VPITQRGRNESISGRLEGENRPRRTYERLPCNPNCLIKPVDSVSSPSLTGDEVFSSLQEVVEHENIHAATFTAIGALGDAVLNYFNWEKKEYEKTPVREKVEDDSERSAAHA
jgi:hypothetical protein